MKTASLDLFTYLVGTSFYSKLGYIYLEQDSENLLNLSSILNLLSSLCMPSVLSFSVPSRIVRILRKRLYHMLLLLLVHAFSLWSSFTAKV